MATQRAPHALINHDGLITVATAAGEHCLGYLLAHQRDVYDAELGRVAVTPEEAQTHNRVLSTAQLAGLDQQCTVGQGATFYLGGGDSRWHLTTWIGEPVQGEVTRRGRTLTLRRGGRTFQGRIGQDPALFLTRIA